MAQPSAPPAMYRAGGLGTEGINFDAPDLRQRVQHLQQELDVTEEIVKDLLSCAGTDIIVIADDSGSMASVSSTDVYNPTTRWDELKENLMQLLTMLLVVDHSDGFTLKFLSESQFHQVTSTAQIASLFRGRKPSGTTPLGANMRMVFSGQWATETKRREIKEAILIVMTDGVPTDTNFEGLAQLVRNRPKTPFPYWVTFVMCTEEDDLVEKYNKHMDPIPGVDVTDDYLSERKEVLRTGKKKFTKNEWLAKAVLGGKLLKYDRKDEKSACCTLM